MTDFKKQTDADLIKTLAGTREGLRLFRWGGSGSKAKNVKQGSVLRKTIARILTELNARRAA